MYTLRNIFSSFIQKVSVEQEKKPIYVNGGTNQVNGGINGVNGGINGVNGGTNQVNGGINGANGGINQVNGETNRDYATFDQEIVSRTNYLLQNKQ